MADNNEKKATINELHRQRAEKNVYIEESKLSAPEQKMFELLRVDTLIRSMSFFTKDSKVKIDENFDKSLQGFIAAYKGSYALVYQTDKEKAEGYENVVSSVKENIKIKSDFSPYENLVAVADIMPKTAAQIEEINKTLSDIKNSEKELADMGGIKKGRLLSEKEEKDEEAEAILEKLTEKYKKQDKNAKIQRFAYTPNNIMVNVIIKKNLVSFGLSITTFGNLNSVEGVSRLNELLNKQSQKASVKADRKADNTKLTENKKQIEETIVKQKLRLERQQKELAKEIKEHLQKMSAFELLGGFDGKNHALSSVLSNYSNADKLKAELVKAFEKEEKIWHYVQDAKYYDMIKDLVRGNYDKNSIVYKAMSSALKNDLEVREASIAGLKEPSANTINLMNKSLEEYGYRIGLQKIKISDDAKPEEYKGKSGSEIANALLAKAQITGENSELTPYKRRYMTLGLMYGLGEGKEKNDDDVLFRQYMQIYFDKKGFTPIDSITLKKEYAWDEFKSANSTLSQKTYKELSENATNQDALKKSLTEGFWSDAKSVSSVHHNMPRRLAFLSSNPDEFNNQPNLAATVQWKAWQDDNHQKEHFFNMSQYDGVLSYLTKQKGDYKRVGQTTDLSEIYYEKPQVKKDGKWQDLIPEKTLLVTPNVVLAEPTLPTAVRTKSLDCFKGVSISDIGVGNVGNGGRS